MQTAGNLSEHIKNDVGLRPVSLATTNATGQYYTMAEFKKALFTFFAAAIADTKTVVAQVMEAQDSAGTGGTALTGATATITSPVKATRANLAGNTIVNDTTTVTITATDEDGEETTFTFTAAATPDLDAGEFDAGASDTAACANLAATINHLFGDKLLGTGSTSNCIVTSKEPGKYTITLSDADSTIVPSILDAQGYIEVDASKLSDGFTHLALKITTDATIVVGACLTRSGGRFGEQQAAAAARVQ